MVRQQLGLNRIRPLSRKHKGVHTFERMSSACNDDKGALARQIESGLISETTVVTVVCQSQQDIDLRVVELAKWYTVEQGREVSIVTADPMQYQEDMIGVIKQYAYFNLWMGPLLPSKHDRQPGLVLLASAVDKRNDAVLASWLATGNTRVVRLVVIGTAQPDWLCEFKHETIEC